MHRFWVNRGHYTSNTCDCDLFTWIQKSQCHLTLSSVQSFGLIFFFSQVHRLRSLGISSWVKCHWESQTGSTWTGRGWTVRYTHNRALPSSQEVIGADSSWPAGLTDRQQQPKRTKAKVIRKTSSKLNWKREGRKRVTFTLIRKMKNLDLLLLTCCVGALSTLGGKLQSHTIDPCRGFGNNVASWLLDWHHSDKIKFTGNSVNNRWKLHVST